MNKTITIILSIILIGGVFYFVNNNSNSVNSSKNKKIEVVKNNNSIFTNISTDKLSKMLENKDFVLIDVHIPEQKHIPQTDYMVPYNEIGKIESVIPNKNSKVVLYCRSGNMSKIVAESLVKKGYTNILNLTNGLKEWTTKNKPVVPKDSIKKI